MGMTIKSIESLAEQLNSQILVHMRNTIDSLTQTVNHIKEQIDNELKQEKEKIILKQKAKRNMVIATGVILLLALVIFFLLRR